MLHHWLSNPFRGIIGFHRNNVMGTHVLLEAAKVHGIKRFIHVSTDEVYGEVVSRVSKILPLSQ
jgi:UDP-glucose 4,6-dehydratase